MAAKNDHTELRAPQEDEGESVKARLNASLSSTHWSWIIHKPVLLFEALSKKLQHIDDQSWRERAAWGGLYVNGRRVDKNIQLKPPTRIEYYEPKFDLRRAEEFFPPLLPEHLIYDDGDIIAFFKPAGLPTLASREQAHFNLQVRIEQRFSTRVHMPSRLDTAAQGIVLASRSVQTHRPLQQLFEQRKIDKRYLLLSSGAPLHGELQIDQPIGRDLRHPILRRIDQTGGRTACTIFRHYGQTAAGLTILEAQPITGRTHQIRIHAASIDHPIIGDAFYGGEPADQLRLVCHQLTFIHPVTGRNTLIILPANLQPKWLNLGHALEISSYNAT